MTTLATKSRDWQKHYVLLKRLHRQSQALFFWRMGAKIKPCSVFRHTEPFSPAKITKNYSVPFATVDACKKGGVK